MSRKLASIQKVLNLQPIPDADAIEIATILGWKVVCKKNEYKPGDLCVYCEIDSVLPEKPEFEFLRPRKFRIKTIRLRGQVSQGICFPLSILPPGTPIEEGADVTELLGIVKYEIPIPAHLQGKVKGKIPSFIPKTDEPRVQILQELLNRHKGEKCYITEKLDGTSVTYYIFNGEFGVCSRNLELLEDDENTYWKVARVFDLDNKLKALNGNFALQGELVGEKIQKNTLKLRGQTVYFFNAYNIEKREYLGFNEFQNFITQILHLKTVPVINANYELGSDIDTLVEMSKTRSTICPENWAEGIVIRPLAEKRDENMLNHNPGGRVSFKVVNPEYLLKYGE